MDAWSGRTALITGASRGIGRATAIQLSAAGCRIAVLARDEGRLRDVAAECVQVAPDDADAPYVVAVDVTDAVAIQDAVPSVLGELGGRLDLLANVAGSALRTGLLQELDDEDWQAVLNLNLLAAVRLQRLCFAALVTAGGAIVNVGSIVAGRAVAGGAPYAAAKAGLASLTRSAAVQWARHGIRANVVEPGYVPTDFNAGLIEAGLEPRLLTKVPTGRPVSPESVARAILFAGHPDNADITGAVVPVDGGWTAKL
jgi:3-oxoacyl-[acyl-carrier protein] reductase